MGKVVSFENEQRWFWHKGVGRGRQRGPQGRAGSQDTTGAAAGSRLRAGLGLAQTRRSGHTGVPLPLTLGATLRPLSPPPTHRPPRQPASG